jgi:hypothetical protein
MVGNIPDIEFFATHQDKSKKACGSVITFNLSSKIIVFIKFVVEAAVVCF